MATVETVRVILQRTPGQPLCDACLAFGFSISHTDMQEITAQLRGSDDFMEGAAACRNCRLLTATTVYCIKCAHCRRPIDRDGRDGLGVMFGGDQFHDRCWRLLSDERVQMSKSLSQESQRLIERSRAVLKVKHQPPTEL